MQQFLRPSNIIVLAGALFLFCLQILPVPNLGGNPTPRNFFGWITVSLTIFALLYQAARIGRLRWDPVIFAAMGSPFVAVLITVAVAGKADLSFAPLFALMPATIGLFLLGIEQYRITERGIIHLVMMMGSGLTFLILLSMWSPAMFDVPQIQRLIPPRLAIQYGGFYQQNNFGSFTAALVLVLAYVRITQKTLPRFVNIVFHAFAGLFAACVFIIESRTSIIGLSLGLVALGVYVVWYQDRAALTRFATITAVSLIGIIFTQIWIMGAEADTRTGIFAVHTLRYRIAMWTVGLDTFLNKPFFGHGLGNFPNVYGAHYAEINHGETIALYNNTADPHNLFVHLLVEAGLFGTLMILTPLTIFFGRVLMKSHENWPLLIVLLPILLHSMVEFPHRASGIHYWLAGMIVLITYRRRLATRLWKLTPATARNVGIAAGAIALICVSILAHAAYLSRQAYFNHRIMDNVSLDVILAGRLGEPDIHHPMLRYDLVRQVYYYLGRRALQENQLYLISGHIRPYYVKEVLPYLQGTESWRVVLGMHLILSDYEAAEAFIAHVERQNPDYARYMAVLMRKFRANDPRPAEIIAIAAELKAKGYPPIDITRRR